MSTLLLFLPPRSRLRAQGRPTSASDAPSTGELGREYDFVLTGDGKHISQQGRSPAAELPHADLVIAIPAESDMSWQRVPLPRAGRQMRPALAGMLEEALLDDPESLHFAVEPDAVGGETASVAITSRAGLALQLQHLEANQVFVDRVTPLSWPDNPPRGHFFQTGLESSPVGLRWSHPEGVTSLSLEGGLTRQLFPADLVQTAQWTAEPAVAAQAEHWLGSPVTVLTPELRALAVIDCPWDLRQFELAQRTRGPRALRNVYRDFMRPAWRPVRWGLAGLVVVQLLGMNVLAWQESHQLKQRRAALETTLTTAYPQVRAIRDAPIQMRRETDLLRASAGHAGDQDLETLLSAAAAAWPAARGPVDALSFETGKLVLSGAGWSDDQIQQFRSQLRSEGWQLDSSEGHLTVRRASRQPARTVAGTGA